MMKPCRARPFHPSASIFFALCWCALLLSVAAGVDVVIDLVFEEPLFGESLDSPPLPEETENITENLLMPSQRADAPAGAASTSILSVDPTAVIAVRPLPASTKASR